MAKGRWMGAVAEENNPKGKSMVKKPIQALTQGLCSKGVKGMRSYLALGETARETTFLRTFLMAAYDLLKYFQTINCI